MFAFLNDIDNYDERKVGRDYLDGLVVSTAYSSDEGYETAICDKNGAHPVQRYTDKQQAESGHRLWLSKANSLVSIIRLGGFGGLVPDKEVKLIRDYTN